jgi:NitT/TauT family transport system ATP-binding protein
VGFARALVTEPEVLLMDEPFSALDVLTAENLRSELTQLISSDEFTIKSVVIVTHNIEEAVTLADRIAVLGSNPGRIMANFDVDLPRPRLRTSPEFQAYIDRVYDILTQAPTKDQSAVSDSVESTSSPKIQRPLPDATTDAIAGFADILLAEGDRSIANLADDLNLEVDDIFPIIEALELLQFADVSSGRVVLNGAGRQYAAATAQVGRQMFSAAALEHAQLVSMIAANLKRSPSHSMRGGYFRNLVGKHHGTKEAEEQLDTAIDWGRYAELFEYDDMRDEFKLPD